MGASRLMVNSKRLHFYYRLYISVSYYFQHRQCLCAEQYYTGVGDGGTVPSEFCVCRGNDLKLKPENLVSESKQSINTEQVY